MSASTTRRLLVLGTARPEHVARCMERVQAPDLAWHLCVKAEHAGTLAREHWKVWPLRRPSLSRKSLDLLLAILRIRPAEIVIVYGGAFFHQNVVSTLAFFCCLTHQRPDISFFNGETGELLRSVSPGGGVYFGAGTLALPGLAAAALLAGLVVLFSWPALLAAGLLLAGVELAWRAALRYAYLSRPGLLAFDGSLESRYDRALRHIQPSMNAILTRHDTLGHENRPNLDQVFTFAIDELPAPHRWRCRTDAEGLRLTAQPGSRPQGLPVIAVHGCSFTFGHGVDDERTWPWLVQETLPGHEVRNRGCAGYSYYQMLLSLRRTLERDRPAAVVVGFLDFLTNRSTNSFDYVSRERQHMGKLPACVSRRKKLREFPPTHYRFVPLSWRSATLRLLEIGLNRWRFRGRGHPILKRRTTEHLLLLMRHLCQRHNAQLLIACLEPTLAWEDFFVRQGFSFCVCEHDFYARDPQRGYLNLLQPYDRHPSALAHERIAHSVAQGLAVVLDGRRCLPASLARGRDAERAEAGDSHIYPVF